jgi:HEAT repeat protein
LPQAPLLEEAGAPDKHVRAHALKQLGVLGGSEAEIALLEALGADDTYIRGTAVLALRDFGDPGVIPRLERMAEDPSNGRILALVRHTLKQLRTKRDTTEASVSP